jgi:hypothetical protein
MIKTPSPKISSSGFEEIENKSFEPESEQLLEDQLSENSEVQKNHIPKTEERKVKIENSQSKPKTALFKLNIILSLIVLLIFGAYFGFQLYARYSSAYPKIDKVQTSSVPKKLIISSISGSSISNFSGSQSSFEQSAPNQGKTATGQTEEYKVSSIDQNLTPQDPQSLGSENIDNQNIYNAIRQIGFGYKQNSSNTDESVKEVQVLPQENK